jgi:hypothetical protein
MLGASNMSMLVPDFIRCLDPNWLIAISTAVYTLFTIVLVCLTFYQSRIQAWIMRPQLKVFINFAPPDCQKTSFPPSHRNMDIRKQLGEIDREEAEGERAILKEGRVEPRVGIAEDKRVRLVEHERKWREKRARVEQEEFIDGYYVRLRVSNSGRGKAELAEVFVTELLEKQPDGTFEHVKRFLPQNLRWSHINESFYPALSPGMEKNCDLGFMVDPRKRDPEDNVRLNASSAKTLFNFAVEVQTSTLNHVIKPGIYRLTLQVAAANAKPRTFKFLMDLNGDWFENEDDMLNKGLRINPL